MRRDAWMWSAGKYFYFLNIVNFGYNYVFKSAFLQFCFLYFLFCHYAILSTYDHQNNSAKRSIIALIQVNFPALVLKSNTFRHFFSFRGRQTEAE